VTNLLQLWFRINYLLDRGVIEPRCVSRFFIQNDKEIKTFRYVG
jgi:hypothetical protein